MEECSLAASQEKHASHLGAGGILPQIARRDRPAAFNRCPSTSISRCSAPAAAIVSARGAAQRSGAARGATLEGLTLYPLSDLRGAYWKKRKITSAGFLLYAESTWRQA